EPDFPSPEKYPTLKDRYTAKLNYEGQVVPSCIHCHQVGDAQRSFVRAKGKPMPDQVIFPHPHPKSLGLILDPKERATVLRVEPKSIAEESGFKKGDVIVKLGGQPLLSIADVQWVLHKAPAEATTIKAEVRRGEATETLTLTLPKGWRRLDDISWRATSWGLRRMATGGMILEPLTAEERKKAGLEENGMALRVKYLGGSDGPHGAAQRAGFRQGDIIVSFDERTDLLRETDLLTHALTQHKVGDEVKATVLRGGKKMDFTL